MDLPIPKKKYRLMKRNTVENHADLQRIRDTWAQLLCVFCREAGSNVPLVPIVLCQKPAFACWKCIRKVFQYLADSRDLVLQDGLGGILMLPELKKLRENRSRLYAQDKLGVAFKGYMLSAILVVLSWAWLLVVASGVGKDLEFWWGLIVIPVSIAMLYHFSDEYKYWANTVD